MVNKLLAPYGIQMESYESMTGFDSINYKIVTTKGQRFVLKHYQDANELPLVDAENSVLSQLKGLSIEISQPIANTSSQYISHYEDGSFSRLLSFVDGALLADVAHHPDLMQSFGQKAAWLNLQLKTIRHPTVEARKDNWDLKYAHWCKSKTVYITDASQRKLVNDCLDQFEQFVLPIQHQLPQQIIHNDLNFLNVLVKNNVVSGFIDFGDMVYSLRINELAVAMSDSMLDKKNPLPFGLAFLKGYHAIFPLERIEIEILSILIKARLCLSISNCLEKEVQLRKAAPHHQMTADEWQKKLDYILFSQASEWQLLHQWLAFNPIEVTNSFLEIADF
jgi:ethanolamine-phosphate phospho-lyase